MKSGESGGTAKPVPSTVSLPILTIAQVARELHLSRAKVYQLVKREGLPALKFGSVLRVRRVSLDKWLELRETAA